MATKQLNYLKMANRLTICILLLTCSFYVSGQQKNAGIYVDSTGQVFIQANLPAYFFVSPESDNDKKILIPSNDSKSNPMYFDGNGVQYLTTNDAETGKTITFKVIADGIGPKISLKFKKGLLMNSGKRFYVDEGSKAQIIAKDNYSGVNSIYVSVDSSPFLKTDSIPFDKGSDYRVKIYAVDNVGNTSDTVTYQVITAINSIAKLNNIYFDVNSSRLRPESKTELNDFVQVLNEYPEIKVEIRAHTDCRGESDYNLNLSEMRAESVVNYLINCGISEDRLTYKGFGDTNPVNECVRGVTCPDEKHQENRRVEFRILPIKQ